MLLDPEETLELSVNEVSDLLKSEKQLLLLDCREQDEYSIANIPGSRLIPMSHFEETFPMEIDKGTLMIIHCHHGMRSLSVTNFLRSKGYRNTFSMEGGIDEWALKINPSLRRY